MGTQSQSSSRFQLPKPNTRALALLAVFAVVQIADGWLTAVGIDRFGLGAEANPLIALPMAFLGPLAALIMAKGIALLGAALLYRFSRHALLAGLTAMYMVVAIMPWAWALSA